MTVIMADTVEALDLRRNKIRGLEITDLVYADDTVIFSSNVAGLNKILAKLEEVAGDVGLRYNK